MLGGWMIYEHNANQLIMPDEFFIPFGGRLNPDNRWIVMASLIPWGENWTMSKAWEIRIKEAKLILSALHLVRSL